MAASTVVKPDSRCTGQSQRRRERQRGHRRRMLTPTPRVTDEHPNSQGLLAETRDEDYINRIGEAAPRITGLQASQTMPAHPFAYHQDRPKQDGILSRARSAIHWPTRRASKTRIPGGISSDARWLHLHHPEARPVFISDSSSLQRCGDPCKLPDATDDHQRPRPHNSAKDHEDARRDDKSSGRRSCGAQHGPVG